MDIAQFGQVAAITVIAFFFGLLAKQTQFIPDRWIPVICAFVGAVLGAVGLYVIPEFPAKDIITAIAVGIVSGLAATGGHQIYRQLTAPVAITVLAHENYDENGDPVTTNSAGGVADDPD